MKRKHFTKSDRQWCYTLLKLIKNAAKLNHSVAESQCSNIGDNKPGDSCLAEEVPQLISSFLNPKNSTNKEGLVGLLKYSKQLNSAENEKCKKKKVSFADNTKGSGDTHSERYCGSRCSCLKNCKTSKRDNEDQNIRKYPNPNSINFIEKEMVSLSEHQSLQSLIIRLDKLKNNPSSTDLCEDLLKSINIGENKTLKSLSPKRRKIRYNYVLTKNSFKKIPSSFLTEIKDAVPGGVDDIIVKHTRMKVSKPRSTNSEELEVTRNSPTTIGFMKRIDTVDQVYGTNPKAVTEAKSTGISIRKPYNIKEKDSSAIGKKIIKNYRDISSSFGENYKRITLALQAKNRSIFERKPLIERTEEFNVESIIQGKKQITADVDEKYTKILRSNNCNEKMKFTGTDKLNKEPSKSDNKTMNYNFDKEMKVDRKRKKERIGMENKRKHHGCDCYLQNMFRDREPYLDRLGLLGI